MSTEGKRAQTRTRLRRKSPFSEQQEIPEYVKKLPRQKLDVNDGFGPQDIIHDEIYTDKESWRLLSEHGIEPEAPIDLLLLAIQNGIIAQHLAVRNSTKGKINKFSQETTIISAILKIKEIGTRKNIDEFLFREIARNLIGEAIDQINKSEIEYKIQRAARRAIERFDIVKEGSANPDSKARELAIRFKKKFELNMARAIDRPEELSHRLEKLLDAIDSLARFGIPIDTSAIRNDLKIRQVGPE